jgi:hypothetical protein
MIQIIFFLLLASSQIFAQDCSPVNLISEPDSPFQKIPVYDQDGSGTCYAYAAAQMADYYSLKNKLVEKRSFHPLWMAIKTAEKKNKDTLENDNAYNALVAVSEYGNCDYETVSKSLSSWATAAKIRESEVLSIVEKYSKSLRPRYLMSGSTFVSEDVNAAFEDAIKEHKPFCSPNASVENLLGMLRSLNVLESPKIFSDLVLSDCSQKKSFKPETDYKGITNDLDLAPTVDKYLSTKKMPMSLVYCASMLFTPEYEGITRPKDGKEQVKKPDCDSHSSLIVGQKKIGDRCHYLVRNSWGSGFGQWTKSWKCLCKNKKTNELVDDCTKATHNNGQFTVEACWIDSTKLSKNSSSIVSFK